MHLDWNDGEFNYCARLIAMHGNSSVGRDPKTVATYLRLQASSAFRDGEYELAARLSAAATCINEDARNNHEPRWNDAIDIMRRQDVGTLYRELTETA